MKKDNPEGGTDVFTAFIFAATIGGSPAIAAPTTPVPALKNVPAEITVPMKDAKGKVIGEAKLAPSPGGVEINLRVKGLTPGEKAFHIHQNGSCRPPDFKSAGDHFAPGGEKHGSVEGGPHAGDMMNVNVKADGVLETEIWNDRVTLEKDKPNSLVKKGGTALVVHAKADDYKSQPSGGAGDRIVCGEIPEAK